MPITDMLLQIGKFYKYKAEYVIHVCGSAHTISNGPCMVSEIYNLGTKTHEISATYSGIVRDGHVEISKEEYINTIRHDEIRVKV